MTTCENCQRYHAAHGYCSMMGREVEPYEMETAADCYWYESRKREEDASGGDSEADR